jgi:hypothetical protein
LLKLLKKARLSKIHYEESGLLKECPDGVVHSAEWVSQSSLSLGLRITPETIITPSVEVWMSQQPSLAIIVRTVKAATASSTTK